MKILINAVSAKMGGVVKVDQEEHSLKIEMRDSKFSNARGGWCQ